MENREAKFKERAVEYFKHYPKNNDVWFTSDGQAFLKQDAAKKHQATIKRKKDLEPYKVSRSDVKTTNKQ